MPDIIMWPYDLLKPASTEVNVTPFSRGGGRTIGGISRSTRTDRGYWAISLVDVALYGPARRRTWDAIATALSGRAGLVVVPAWSIDTAPFASGKVERSPLASHSDGSTFSDGSRYRGQSISVRTAAPAAIGDTSIQLEIVYAIEDLAGVRFSYQHALYKTGRALEVDGSIWTVELATTIRAPIPLGAELEFDRPMCLCHLANDREMDVRFSAADFDLCTVSFVEAADYWSDLAAGLIE